MYMPNARMCVQVHKLTNKHPQVPKVGIIKPVSVSKNLKCCIMSNTFYVIRLGYVHTLYT